MKRKGFTLVELLAVVVVLAIVMAIAIPAISSLIEKSKINTMEASIKLIADNAEQMYNENIILNKETNFTCSEVADVEVSYDACTITFDSEGKSSVSLKGKLGTRFYGIICSGNRNEATCTEFDPNFCKFSGDLVVGATYEDDQYTYVYKQEYNGTSWTTISDDGWGVVQNNKESTSPVITKLCTIINNKPVVSMSHMFYNSQAQSIDFKTFNTSYVKNMSGMFWNSKATELDLKDFNTDEVRNMSNMFKNSSVTNLDLDSFNTSNVKNMSGMFSNTNMTKLDLSTFNTSNVTNMSNMFENSKANILDLSSFDTSNVSSSSNMFSSALATKGYAKTWTDANRFNSTSGKPSTLSFISRSNPCTYSGTLTKGAEYVNGQYTYRYMQNYGDDGWSDIDDEGWGVILTNKSSTSAVNTKVCTSISNKPIVSMRYMFSGSQATSIDLSGFYTDNVTDMEAMFKNTKVTTLNLSDFNTFNVEDMSSMFEGSKLSTLDLSGFSVESLSDFDDIFKSSTITLVYVATNEDVAALMASENLPSGISIMVKP